MKHITLSIQYAGLTLPIVQNDQGVGCVPLKPLCDLFGLKWERQRLKVSEPFYKRHLGIYVLKALVATPHKGGAYGTYAPDAEGADGTCAPLMGGADDQARDHTCIRIDRVAAFLMTINPDRVRAIGNTSGADFLEAKLTEWADALHDYETFGVAHNPRHADALLALRRANAIAKASSIKDARVRALALAELGIEPEASLPGTTPPAPGATGDLFPPAAA